jgi:hypothetical protein
MPEPKNESLSGKKNPPDGGFFLKIRYAADGQDAQEPSFGHTCGGFGLESFEYPSVYQPLPLREKLVLEISFSMEPPQAGQMVAGSSENFWRNSNSLPQSEQ